MEPRAPFRWSKEMSHRFPVHCFSRPVRASHQDAAHSGFFTMFKPSPERAFGNNARRLWRIEGKIQRQEKLRKRKEDAAMASCGIGSPGMAGLDPQALGKMGSAALEKISEKTAPFNGRIGKLQEKRGSIYLSCVQNVSEIGAPAASRLYAGKNSKDRFMREVIVAFCIVSAAKAAMIAAGVGFHLGATLALAGTVFIYLAWRYALQRIINRQQHGPHGGATTGKGGAEPDRLTQLFIQIKDSLSAGTGPASNQG